MTRSSKLLSATSLQIRRSTGLCLEDLEQGRLANLIVIRLEAVGYDPGYSAFLPVYLSQDLLRWPLEL